ncbi:MAG: Uncharacterized protein G01um101424_111 [Parcubacteria group bacterium Gr01-1014_24]|nr:MAG: Uncharacterized protein G01um101424_111 [Parcubacteria group bacterium Gr01-1014_24]
MKKILIYILILIILVGVSLPIYAQTQTPCQTDYVRVGGRCVPASSYILLAPLPCAEGTPGCIDGKLKTFNPEQKDSAGKSTALGTYLNLMIKIIIGLAAVLSVIMIVVGGLEYMTSELISSKEEGKKRILGAIFGLLLALGAYALLNTINPDLLSTDIKIDQATITVTLDEANFAKTEQTVATAGTRYALSGAPSPGVSDFIRNRLSQGQPLRTIVVDTSTRRAYFYVGPAGNWNTFVAVPVNLGLNGIAEIGQAQAGDGKTPKGTTTLGSVALASNGNAVTVAGGRYNVGAAFVNVGATINGTDRGIGFHGSANNALGTTNGCIRMTNDDLAALTPYMRAGVTVLIK